MSNQEYAQAMRREADKWIGYLPVTKELWLQIADRIEASPDPAGTLPFRGIDNA